MSNFAEKCALMEMISPDQRGASTVTGATWYELKAGHPLTFIAMVGEMAATSTLDFKVQQATDSSGSGAKDLKTATQLTDTDDDKAVCIECFNSDLDQANSFTHIRPTVTTAAANVDWAMLVVKYFGTVIKGGELNAAFVDEAL